MNVDLAIIKKKYMEQLKIKNKEVPKKDYIYYLGSIIHMENDRAEDIYS